MSKGIRREVPDINGRGRPWLSLDRGRSPKIEIGSQGQQAGSWTSGTRDHDSRVKNE